MFDLMGKSSKTRLTSIIIITAVIGTFAAWLWFMWQKSPTEPPGVPHNLQFVLERTDAMKTEFAGVTKIEALKEAMKHRLETVSENVNLALRVYGGGCGDKDTELAVPFTRKNDASIRRVMDSLELQRRGSLMTAVQAAIADFMDEQFRECHNAVIFIVGGVDSCHSDDKLAEWLRASNINWTRLDDVRFVGIGLSGESQARFQQIASAIPAALALSVDDAGQLRRAIGSRQEAEVLLLAKQSFVEGKELYEKGEFDSALPFLENAANENIATATHYLGTIYFYGRGSISPDFEMAAHWYRKGAALNNPIAMFNLGVMYDPDVRLQIADLDSAKFWYDKAAKLGHQEAQKRLQELAR